MLVGDSVRVEMRTRRLALDNARARMIEHSKDDPLHERVAAYGQMIAATLAQPSSNFASEMHAVARRAHFLLWMQVGLEVFETHDYVIVQMRDNVLQVGSFATEDEFLEAQEEMPGDVLPAPTKH